MSDIVISGYYGLGNSGDEALLKSIIENLQEIAPDVTITALSGNVRRTKQQYGAINTVNRFNIFSVLRELRGAKLLLSGGGTLIQDATSTKSLLYYLGIIYAAKRFGLKVMLYANGMGPIKDKNVGKVHRVLNEVDLITLRENESLHEIERCKITKPKVVVTADPAFNLTPANAVREDELLAEFSVPTDKKLLAVSVRGWKQLGDAFEIKMACALDRLSEEGYFPVFMPMQMSTDLAISRRIIQRMKKESVIIDRELPVSELLALIGRCDIACGMRLHMLIFASVMNVPMTGIVYDPKIRGFMEYMNQKKYVELSDFNAETFFEMVLECGKNSEQMKAELKKTSAPLRKRARENAQMAIELLKRKKK
mgnify:CR=1 FL=1